MRKDHIEAPYAAAVQVQVAYDSELLHPASATGLRGNRASGELADQLTQHAVEVKDAAGGYFGEVNALDVGLPHCNIPIVAGAQADERAAVVRHSSLDAGDLVCDALCSG